MQRKHGKPNKFNKELSKKYNTKLKVVYQSLFSIIFCSERNGSLTQVQPVNAEENQEQQSGLEKVEDNNVKHWG